jgi:hypothetical protein
MKPTGQWRKHPHAAPRTCIVGAHTLFGARIATRFAIVRQRWRIGRRTLSRIAARKKEPKTRGIPNGLLITASALAARIHPIATIWLYADDRLP